MNNAYALYSNLLFAKAGNCGIPLSGTFELTARCNLDCRMCYIHRRENDAAARAGELTAAQWLALAAANWQSFWMPICCSCSPAGSHSSARISGKSIPAAAAWACW